VPGKLCLIAPARFGRDCARMIGLSNFQIKEPKSLANSPHATVWVAAEVNEPLGLSIRLNSRPNPENLTTLLIGESCSNGS
jgi:hypothetical protein